MTTNEMVKEFDARCRVLVRSHEHLREGRELLSVRLMPHLVIQHYHWVCAGKPIEELTAFYNEFAIGPHTTCWMSQNGSLSAIQTNGHWVDPIRRVLPWLRTQMILDDLAAV